MKLIPLEGVENFFWNKALKSRGDDTVMYINLKDEILKLPTIDPIQEIDKMIEELEGNADGPKIARATLVELKRRLSLTQK